MKRIEPSSCLVNTFSDIISREILFECFFVYPIVPIIQPEGRILSKSRTSFSYFKIPKGFCRVQRKKPKIIYSGFIIYQVLVFQRSARTVVQQGTGFLTGLPFHLIDFYRNDILPILNINRVCSSFDPKYLLILFTTQLKGFIFNFEYIHFFFFEFFIRSKCQW